MGRSSLFERMRGGRGRARAIVRHGGVASAALLGLGATVGFGAPHVSDGPPSASPERSALAGVRLWVSPYSDARRQADAWRRSRPADAAALDRIASQPVAQWLGDWTSDPRGTVASAMSTASGTLPIFVVYDIPKRDCGGYSAGGARDEGAYRSFVQRVADGLGGRRAVVVLEPDALAGMSCLSQGDQDRRVAMIASAITTLKARGATVYVDAGHPDWVPAPEMANRLRRAGIAQADGFALNVSNFYTTAQNVAYGRTLSSLTGGKHYVIDTSRNGNGAAGSQWCNPAGRALGAAPTAYTGISGVDAFLWIKTPGQSDGTCNGGPRAGQFWPDYALGLAQHAGATFASR